MAVVILSALAATGCAARTATAGPGALAANIAAATRGPITSLSGPIVALGDSYTAGDQIPMAADTLPTGCFRSTSAYPLLVATALHDASGLIDVACSGAGVQDMTLAQSTSTGPNSPQFASLSAGDQLVLLTLSGDDVGFSHVLSECMALSWTAPWGTPCAEHFTSGGTDQLASRIAGEASRMAAVLATIHAKAPAARVVLVGYPDLFPQQGGCWPVVPITDGDIGYLRGEEVRLNAMLAAAAKATGTLFVDTYAATMGHDFCSSSSARYVEGLIPGSLTVPFHPNGRGQAAMASLVLAALRAA